MSIWTRGDDHYEVLLLFVVVVLVMAPFGSPVLRTLTIAMLGVTLTFAFWTSGASRIAVAVVSATCIAAVAIAIAGQFGAGKFPHSVSTAIGTIMCGATIAMVSTHLAAQTRVSRRTVTGALSVYLLLGTLFAYLYGFLDATTAHGFFAQHGHHSGFDYIYFSYVSLTTVGYGDLTAGSSLGRMMAILEALIGQLYLVTIVAVVVANIGRERSRQDRRER